MSNVIKDASKSHWVYKAPERMQPYLQLSRLDRPVGYWLLTLPGWIGLAFASLGVGFAQSDLKWAVFILIGAVAMRGAGCTYNDIVDQDLDAQVDRTALRPLPAGAVTTKQAWIWLFAQCGVGLVVLLCLPRLAQIIALASIPLVAAYPFMKRITWWPQVWLGMTFNWAVLVAYAAKTGVVSGSLFILYLGLIFWTVGYDTIYACQDIEDDAMIGVKSTARRFGSKLITGLSLSYLAAFIAICVSVLFSLYESDMGALIFFWAPILCALAGFGYHLNHQLKEMKTHGDTKALVIFKSNFWAGIYLIIGLLIIGYTLHGNIFEDAPWL
ncbi:4-hydroxybenzoate octaprenyltransferase [Fretibacter rubidus]|uniref:4-hydroxybenzoate octaprenyltransferase n=1 Tax=Fretibacter rubidus TaxID=570162 RepID=UPI003529EA27